MVCDGSGGEPYVADIAAYDGAIVEIAACQNALARVTLFSVHLLPVDFTVDRMGQEA